MRVCFEISMGSCKQICKNQNKTNQANQHLLPIIIIVIIMEELVQEEEEEE